ncbi:NAD(P)H-quinone oxidoreductase subunit K, chloroplastic [Paraburkholderia hiiakae]|uniref:NAD(P)H-quinone oxidoreductase subunit K, chloroplastic n=1 Tax=Paraburkholderia hiiakae TaxID=1081782 RepID=A0ABN7IA01_9BURK|nr:NADH-quinone oxidoreductase subunit NuoB [Paraburkholderia hiiakae]CAD6553149.1 NAD(P)H-quinone oxidoreductase subunit K, chloroplastic [Paraburkholderia hiiakae]
MSLWTWFGLKEGSASTGWPLTGDEDGQEAVLGMPRYEPAKCKPDCEACVEVCPTRAIVFARSQGSHAEPRVDWGRCVVCQRCTEVCPSGAFSPSEDWALGVRERSDLEWDEAMSKRVVREVVEHDRRAFGRSVHIRHVDAGSCNGCESELQALNNPFYNLHRLGIFFTPSPRFADVLLVTGPVTKAMHEPLLSTWDAMPTPKWVIATGTCAVSGGMTGGNYACGTGLDGILPVDVYLPGCPPNPAALIHALLLIVGRTEQRVRGGKIER